MKNPRGSYSPDYYSADKWMGRGAGKTKRPFNIDAVEAAERKHYPADPPYIPKSKKEEAKMPWNKKGRGGTPPAGHHSANYWKNWAKEEHKSDTAAKNEYTQGENAIERKIPSETTPGKTYRVWGEKGNMHCSCPSYTYRNTCKHVQTLGEEGPKRKMKYGRNYYYPSK